MITQLQGEESEMQLSIDHLETYLDSIFLIKEEKKYILGTISLNKNDVEDAIEYFKVAITKQKSRNNVYVYKKLCEVYFHQGDEQQSLEYAKKSFDQILSKDYNEMYHLIEDLILPFSETIEGRNFGIEVLETILDKTNDLEYESQVNYLQILEVLYNLNQNYSASLDVNVKIINMSKESTSHYSKGIALANLALTARQSGAYDAAELLLNTIDDTQLDEENKIILNLYRLFNLSEIKIILNKSDGVLEIIDEIEKYEPYVIGERREKFEYLKSILSIYVYMSESKFDEATSMLEAASYYVKQDSEETFSNTQTLFYITSGHLYKASHQYDLAIQSFTQVLTLLEEISSHEYQRIALTQLIEIYGELGDFENQSVYIQKRQDLNRIENEIISAEYLKYFQLRFNHDRIVTEKIIAKTSNILLIVILIVLIRFFYKKCLHGILVKEYNRYQVRKYLNNNNYYLVYQPIIEPKKSKIVGFEALLRLKVNGQVIMPSEFIKQIKQCDMLNEVTIWIFSQILNMYDELKESQFLKEEFYISINSSLNEIENEHFCNKLVTMLKEAHLPQRAICIEITENAAGSDEKLFATNLQYLRDEGFMLALDDFGMEYSNFSMLDKFNFDTIKFDKCFIDMIGRLIIHQKILEVADYIAIHKDRKIIIEGVESVNQQQLIKNTVSENVYIQGYFYSKPLEKELLQQFIIEHYKI